MRPAPRTVARISLLALVLSAVLVAGVAASLRTDAARAAEEKLPSYRCCFRIDTLMTGRLDTVFDDVVLSAPQHATWTFRNSELVTYAMTGSGPRIQRAWARKGGPWPRTPTSVSAHLSRAFGQPVQVAATNFDLLPNPRLVVTGIDNRGRWRLSEVSLRMNWSELWGALRAGSWTWAEATVAPRCLVKPKRSRSTRI